MMQKTSLLRVLSLALCLGSGALAATKSSGCGQKLPPGLTTGGTGQSNAVNFTQSDGTKRTYLLHLPTNCSNNDPRGLIFSFHGRSRTAASQEELSQFSNPFFNPNMLAVYPQGIDNEWQGDPDAKTNDVAFTLELIDHLTSTFCIDEQQIYAAGKSNGGGFSANILACDPKASTRIAAFASCSGAYYQGDSEDNCNGETVPIKCTPGRTQIPIFETHGSADTTIPYNGGPRRGRCLPSIPHFMTAWSERNGLGSHNQSTSEYSGNVIHYEYGTSHGQKAVDEHYYIKGLAHQWPSTVPNSDGGSTYFNATELIMEFFGKHTLPALPKVY